MTELGLWAQLSTNLSFARCFRITPPITTTEEQLEEAFRSTEGSMPLYRVDGKAEANSQVQSRL